MKNSKFRAELPYGSQRFFNENPEQLFRNDPAIKAVYDNQTNELLFSRNRDLVGYIHSGVRFFGMIKVYRMDDGFLVTNLGQILSSEFDRISKIEKNRTGETYILNLDFNKVQSL